MTTKYLLLIISHEHGCSCSDNISLIDLSDNELGKAYNMALDLLGETPDEIFLISDSTIVKRYAGERWK